MCWHGKNGGNHVGSWGYIRPVTCDRVVRVVRVTSFSLLVSQDRGVIGEQSLKDRWTGKGALIIFFRQEPLAYWIRQSFKCMLLRPRFPYTMAVAGHACSMASTCLRARKNQLIEYKKREGEHWWCFKYGQRLPLCTTGLRRLHAYMLRRLYPPHVQFHSFNCKRLKHSVWNANCSINLAHGLPLTYMWLYYAKAWPQVRHQRSGLNGFPWWE